MGKVKAKPVKNKLTAKKMRRYIPLYLMLLPGAIYLIINNYMPMAGLALSFKDVNYHL